MRTLALVSFVTLLVSGIAIAGALWLTYGFVSDLISLTGR